MAATGQPSDSPVRLTSSATGAAMFKKICEHERCTIVNCPKDSKDSAPGGRRVHCFCECNNKCKCFEIERS
jgi:hypothetical protein